MHIPNGRIVVEKIEEPKAGGFKIVSVQDNFVYQGRVIIAPESPIVVGAHTLVQSDIVLFAKYSPDTHEMDYENRKVKFVKAEDILAVL